LAEQNKIQSSNARWATSSFWLAESLEQALAIKVKAERLSKIDFFELSDGWLLAGAVLGYRRKRGIKGRGLRRAGLR